MLATLKNIPFRRKSFFGASDIRSAVSAVLQTTPLISGHHCGGSGAVALAGGGRASAVRAVDHCAVWFARRKRVDRHCRELDARAELDVSTEERRVALHLAFGWLAGHKNDRRTIKIGLSETTAPEDIAVVAKAVAGRIDTNAVIGRPCFGSVEAAG